MNDKGRLESFDFVKGLLIILVVWGHFCSHSSGLDYEKNVLTAYIRLFQMPMFILISGFFQKEVLSIGTFVKRIKKTTVHIGLPLLIWLLSATLTLYLLKALGLYDFTCENVLDLLKMFYKNLWFYWFLPCLMFCILFNAIITLLAKSFKIKAVYLYVISTLLLLLVPIDLFHFQFMWPFFIMGICVRFYSQDGIIHLLLKGKAPRCVGIVLLILWGGVFISSQFWPTNFTFYNIRNCVFIEGYNLLEASLFIVLRQCFYMVATLVTFYFMLKLYYKFKEKTITKNITVLGTETLFVYLFHLIVVAYMFGIIVKQITNNIGLLPEFPTMRYYVVDAVLTVVMILISHFLYKAIEQSSFLSKILIGK